MTTYMHILYIHILYIYIQRVLCRLHITLKLKRAIWKCIEICMYILKHCYLSITLGDIMNQTNLHYFSKVNIYLFVYITVYQYMTVAVRK